MENKKSKTGLHVFVGILLGIIICGGVVFATYSLGYLTFNQAEEPEKTETNNEENNETEEDVNDNSLDFDTSKVVNSTADLYELQNYNGTINVRLDNTRKIATLSFNRKTLSDTYGLNWDTTGVVEGTVEDKVITFTQGVKDIYIGGIGQDMSGDIILFLMDDGTVEYIPVYKALSTGEVDGLTSYGTLQDLKDVVKFYSVTAIRNPVGSSVTIIAQTKDGTLYDLAPIINDASNNQ